MQRFLSALSLTVLLSGVSALAQVQPAQNPVDRVIEAGLMSPTSNGDFQADTILSRAELASILVKTFQLNQRTPNQTAAVAIQDVPRSHWAYDDIQTVLRSGVMTGYREGRFFPDQRVTRAEAFSIFAQAYGVFQFPDATVNDILSRYPDAGSIPAWARKSMATALYEGFVNTDPNSQIDPLGPMTRGDMAHALGVYLSRQETPSGFPWAIGN
ncbi:S-layer homology domain-containing protein [Oculatella sp. LEGE 06141]|uniref:S-layer homology domain-containing protein n=1 Tax=Oculatella sp. LEGE 06141 TaxID=1828648 RepID=UPI00187F72DD|nr:S-layer homology domain-containing protein [Oculatella sp. LEGE 06141]MBE9181436.1 S-layer homology domain-containing protein [Oculatella sp. LEGE 06141]